MLPMLTIAEMARLETLRHTRRDELAAPLLTEQQRQRLRFLRDGRLNEHTSDVSSEAEGLIANEMYRVRIERADAELARALSPWMSKREVL